MDTVYDYIDTMKSDAKLSIKLLVSDGSEAMFIVEQLSSVRRWHAFEPSYNHQWKLIYTNGNSLG